MLIHAIWLLEAEKKFLKKHTSNWPEVKGNEFSYTMLALGATAQTAVVSISTYAGVQKAYSVAAAYGSNPMAGQIKGFRIASPGFKAVPYGYATKYGAKRLIAARIGARFIPYVGWGLLAYDAYLVGKWVHGKTRWGNPTPGPTP